MRVTPTAPASAAARRPSASSRPTNRTSCAGSASQASFVPKPARSAVMQTAPGMCASSNWSSVRTSTSSAPSARRRSSWRGASGCASVPSWSSGPRLTVDDVAEVRRLRPERRERRPHELVLVVDRERRVVRALEPDRRADLEVHAGPAAHRAAQVPGPQLDLAGQREDLSVQRVEDPARALVAVDGQVGPRDVADEQAVAREHGPGRVVAARRVEQQERGVLGTVPRRVQRAHAQRAEPQLPAVVERLVRVAGCRFAVDVDRRAGRRREPAVARHVIGVRVRLEHVLDAHAEVARERQVLLDVELGVDDRGDAGVLVADQVGRAAEVVVGHLAKQHASTI